MKWVGYITPDYKRRRTIVLFHFPDTLPQSTLEESVGEIIQGDTEPALLWEGQTPVLGDFHPT